MLTGKRPFNDIKTEPIVAIEVAINGKKPDRPLSGFSDKLWNILLLAWDAEYGSQPPKRPSIQTILNQLKEDADNWDQFIILPASERGKESCTSHTVGNLVGFTHIPIVAGLLGDSEWGVSDSERISQQHRIPDH